MKHINKLFLAMILSASLINTSYSMEEKEFKVTMKANYLMLDPDFPHTTTIMDGSHAGCNYIIYSGPSNLTIALIVASDQKCESDFFEKLGKLLKKPKTTTKITLYNCKKFLEELKKYVPYKVIKENTEKKLVAIEINPTNE